MIIYSGWGFLVAIFGVGAAIIAGSLDHRLHFSSDLVVTVALLLMAVPTVVVGNLVNSRRRGGIAIDKRTGVPLRLRRRSSVFWIPMEYWGYLAIALAAYVVIPKWRDLSAEVRRIAEGAASQTALERDGASSSTPEAGVSAQAAPVVATPSRSSSAQAAYDYLAKSLSGDHLQLVLNAHFEAVGGDICHIEAIEDLSVKGGYALDVGMADIDLKSPTIKGEGEVHEVYLASARDKKFRASFYHPDVKKWTDWTELAVAVFMIAGGDETTILRAFDTLAKECGAKPNEL